MLASFGYFIRIPILAFLATAALLTMVTFVYLLNGYPLDVFERFRTRESMYFDGKQTEVLDNWEDMKLTNRKLLDLDRVGDACTVADITILQGETSPLPNGIPTYTVQIFNLCVVGCPISNIHIACGWFASTKLINPKIFRRERYNDCIVNDGKPLRGGESVSFQYANSFEYTLTVASINTCR